LENVLITGANKGLGLSLTKVFLDSGSRVFAGIHHESEYISNLKKQFQDRLFFSSIDVTSEMSVKEFRKVVTAHTSSLDILINNAGILIRKTLDNTIENIDIANMKKTFEVNSIGPLIVLKYFINMIEKGKRKIVLNITSRAGSISICKRVAWYDYCMSKTAINMGSKILQNYLKEKGVKVLAMHPGWMRTEMGTLEADISSDESAAGIIELVNREWDIDDNIYFDYSGKRLEW